MNLFILQLRLKILELMLQILKLQDQRNSEDKRLIFYAVAKSYLGKDVAPRENELGCAEAVNFIFKKEFKEKLDNWCVENRFRKLSDMTILKYMKEKGIDSEKKQADWFTQQGEKPRFNAWLGLKWK